jgi:hypothetical protein
MNLFQLNYQDHLYHPAHRLYDGCIPADPSIAAGLLILLEDTPDHGISDEDVNLLRQRAGARQIKVKAPAPEPALTPFAAKAKANRDAGEARRAKVVAALKADASLTNAELARAFKVSRATVAAVRKSLRMK